MQASEDVAELFRKKRELEQSNMKLERRVAELTAELAASNALVRQSRQKCNLALAAGQMGSCLALTAGQMGSWDWEIAANDWQWDEGQHRIFGVDPRKFEVTAENIRRLIHPDDWQSLRRCAKRMSKGVRTQQAEFRVLRPNGETRWCVGTAAASVDAAGRIVRISGVTIDVTERKEAEERQALLAREVDHRARNALAVIQSIIRLTRANSVGDYVKAIEGRIKALARAHTLLSDSRWHGADLANLVAEELAPYRAGDQVAIAGPDISLPPAMAQGLALALHELVTNAAKHGALSVATGEISLDWHLRPDALILNWAENGGSRITPPAAESFGLRVIRASIERQLGGKATFDWDPKGLRCSLSIPRRDIVKSFQCAGAGCNVGELHGAASGSKTAAKLRVLLVEDDALVAMMIRECLVEFGCQVVGPISTAAEAVAKAKDGRFEAAVLDINLGDGPVYPVADILAARGVPFVFVTGYDFENVDSRFRNVPILQKPIEREMLKGIFAVAAKAPVAG